MNSCSLKWALTFVVGVLFCTGNIALAAPVNDSCYNATPVEEVVSLPFDTTYATSDGPRLFITGPNIWYRYTATRSGEITVSLCGSSYDTKLAIYSGGECYPTNARVIEFDDDTCGLQSEITLTNVVAGNQYLIEVGGYGTYKGPGIISITGGITPNQPANDLCQNAEAIGEVINKAFNTSFATFDGPGLCIMQGPNIWYKYTASCTGQATVSLCGSSFDTVLAVYRGAECYPIQSRLVGCNDDTDLGDCQHQSQLSFSVEAGSVYLIEIGGHSNSKGPGLLTVSCEGISPNLYDLGDAPDSTNNFGRIMTTYSTSVQAKFPTVFTDGASTGPYGPFHFSPRSVAYLGSNVTLELEADTGQDQDSINNITPLINQNNQDKGDNGVVMPLNMPKCKWNTFSYLVNVVNPNTNLYVNVWFDWNRDGDWNDDTNTNPTMYCSKGIVSEWAVKNQLLFNLPVGMNTITSPAFLAWHPETGPKNIWMRITLSTIPWTGGSGAGGSGPQTGYQFGETEDYYFEPTQAFMECEDINGDGFIDFQDLAIYLDQWFLNCQ